MKINILGASYTIVKTTKEKDAFLAKADGYCDKTTRKIVVVAMPDEETQIADFYRYQRKVLRHEIIHAFLFESGLGENWTHEEYGHDETYVDWIAVQFPKLLEAFKAAGCSED